ncbi:MAG: transcription termination factor NusA [Epsilonproteobacteria bacterium]|nr:transcription termination factor NusA [Campylobacterota bacterium]
MNLVDVIEGLVEERGLEKEKVISIVCDGIRAAYTKRYPDRTFHVQFNKKSGTLELFVEKTVVSSVTDDAFEISLRRAKVIDPDASLDQVIWVPFDQDIGRIEILTAKQYIASKIRDLEQQAVYEEFSDKTGTLLNGVIHKRERAGYVIKVGDVMGLLPRENTVPGEALRMGHPVKVLLQEVLSVARGDYQLILDRASADFVQKLLELEIPEIFEGIVEIKKIVRNPGYKTKVIVASTSREIDPVGTCVGVGGARIKPILRVLGQEKIDLIEETDVLEQLVKDSLKPAEIDKVEILDNSETGTSRAQVWLAQDQRSFAIGKQGQNIALASKLVGLDIQLQDVATGEPSLMLEDIETEGNHKQGEQEESENKSVVHDESNAGDSADQHAQEEDDQVE